MQLSAFIGKHIKEVYFGKNWTAVNLKDTLSGIDWKMATQKVEPFHTIAELVYHMNYYINTVLKVYHGGPLKGNDAVSFDCPPIESQQAWEAFLENIWAEVNEFARLTAELSDEKLDALIGEEKYGSYQRNLFGIIEHCHYHLGQIVWLKKMILQNKKTL